MLYRSHWTGLRAACWMAVALSAVFSVDCVYSQSNAVGIPPVDPEIERASFILPEGFEVNLFAADPKIAKPIQINFDPAGRLWVVSSEVYPHIEPGKPATDKVLVLEDLDSDGVSDKTHVFAEGLLIPTGVAPGDGGAYVGASTELLHFADDDGDLKADRTRVVLSGFGTEDTHHILHTLRWGPEQRLYMSQSIYIHSHIETPWGVKRLNAGGIWQFRPDTLQLDILMRGLVNSWGTAFDKFGATFATDGAGGEGINYVVPGASYATAYGAARILPGLNPGSPKHCGLEIVEAESLPDDWQGSFLTNDFRGHRVCRFTLTPDGSGFISQEQQELIKSNHGSFRPVDIKLGPDGALYIADWFNPIIQHGEVDFRDPRRDHVHGRIWRVTYTGKPALPRPQLVGASTPDLLQQLESPNRWTREQSKRLLKERGTAILPDVARWMNALDNTRADYHRVRLEALWLHLAVDVPNAELLNSLLVCRDPQARAGATRVIGDWLDRLPNSLSLLESRVADDDGRVRLEAVRVLSLSRDPLAIELAARAMEPAAEKTYATEATGKRAPAQAEPVEFDRWLEYALWLTARDLQPIWEPALLNGELDFDGNAQQLAFVLRAAGSNRTVPAVFNLLTAADTSVEQARELVNVISEFGNPDQLRQLYQLAINTTDDQRTNLYLDGLANSPRRGNAAPGPNEVGLLERAASGDVTVRANIARLIGVWKWAQGMEWLTKSAMQTEEPALQQAAIGGLSAFGREDALGLLGQLANGEHAVDVRRAAITGILPHQPHLAAKLAAELLTQLAEPGAATGIVAPFLGRPDAAKELAAQLTTQTARGSKMPADAAVLALRSLRASGQQLPELETALASAGGVSSEPKMLTPEELTSLMTSVTETGDPARGEVIYRREELACQKCHAIGDAGGQIGPNMLSLGATAPVDYLLQSLLDPNAKVKEGYHTAVLVDDDGRQWAGIKLRQTDDAVILRNAEGVEISVPLASIETEVQGISLMPAGLTEKLTRQELIDLTAFLSALGRLPNYTVGQTPTARRWQLMQATPQAAQQLRRTSYGRATSDDSAFQWSRAFSRVDGSLPVGELPEVAVRNRVAEGSRGVSFVRTEINVDRAGAGVLKLTNPTGLQVWLNGEPLEVKDRIPVDLPAGRHRLTISLDRSATGDALKVELLPADGSPLLATFPGGA
ncbi:MAG: HEAT repeat domain-containing protein [Planctomycetaceae bacterium]